MRFIDRWDLDRALARLENIAPDQLEQTLTDADTGKLDQCGIQVYQIARERAIRSGIGDLPPTYEQMHGNPGDQGFSPTEVLNYLNRR